MTKESGEIGVIAFVVNNETHVDRNIAITRRHWGRVAVAAWPVSSFIDGDVMGFIQEPGTAHSGYAATNDRYSHHATI